MGNYWYIVNRVISTADILLEIIDARAIDASRNHEIEDKVRDSGKTLIFVVNKCDLVNKEDIEKVRIFLKPSVFVSAKERLGTNHLRDEIMKRAPKGEFKVGVLGYPNTGKSSIINLLRGKSDAAPTSPVSGFTRGFKFVRVSRRMLLIDTPGVFPYKENDEEKHAMISARTFENLKDPEGAAMAIIEQFSEDIEKYYGVVYKDDSAETLDEIALKINKLRKGGLPDTNAATRVVLADWQTGKIRDEKKKKHD